MYDNRFNSVEPKLDNTSEKSFTQATSTRSEETSSNVWGAFKKIVAKKEKEQYPE